MSAVFDAGRERYLSGNYWPHYYGGDEPYPTYNNTWEAAAHGWEDESFAVLLSWALLTTVLAFHTVVALVSSHLVEKRRTKEISELMESSRRPYTKSTENEDEEEAAVGDDDPHAECPLCLEDFVEGVEVSKLPCGHTFHTSCISDWLNHTTFQARTCPNCRQTPLVSDVELEEIERENARREEEERGYSRTAAGGAGGQSFSMREAMNPSDDTLAASLGGFMGLAAPPGPRVAFRHSGYPTSGFMV